MSATVVRLSASVVVSVALGLLAAGCGGSSGSASSVASSQEAGSATGGSTSSAGSAATRAATQTTATGVTVSSGGLQATLHAPNHTPKAGRLWHYTVSASDSSGHPVAGTVATEFVFGGQVVGRESPPTHTLTHGRLNDKVTFPARAVGIPLSVRIVIDTRSGSVTLDWPVKVTT